MIFWQLVVGLRRGAGSNPCLEVKPYLGLIFLHSTMNPNSDGYSICEENLRMNIAA
jgi:hypothetical protein